MAKTYPNTSIKERILQSIRIDSRGCWIWTGRLNPKGYGETSVGGRNARAHRVSFEAFTDSTIPVGMVLDHTCRNRPCVNPDHLRVVTPSENTLVNSASNAAQNLTKTHCAKGHPFTPENTKVTINKNNGRLRRMCRACRRANRKRLRAQRLAAQLVGAHGNAGRHGGAPLSPDYPKAARTIAVHPVSSVSQYEASGVDW